MTKPKSMGPMLLFGVMLGGWMNEGQRHLIEYLLEENRMLRERLGPRRLRFTGAERRRLAIKAKKVGRRLLLEVTTLVTPDTLLRWYRTLVAMKYDSSDKRRTGRPRKASDVRELVVRMATENVSWGYTKIRDAMFHLGHDLGRGTVQRILDEHGIEPAPERRKRLPWNVFLKAHWGAIAAMDFFQVEVMTLFGPVRYAVLFVIDLKSRRVEIAGVTHDPYSQWMLQMARNLTDGMDGFLLPARYLIMDRDPLFTREFRAMLRRHGVRPLRLPARSPNLNAHAERFVRSIKEECLERIIPLSEGHLRDAITQYMAHYHTERFHQGLGGSLVAPRKVATVGGGAVRRDERLGGLLSYYHREAA